MAEVPLDNIKLYWEEIHKSKGRWGKLEDARVNQAKKTQELVSHPRHLPPRHAGAAAGARAGEAAVTRLRDIRSSVLSAPLRPPWRPIGLSCRSPRSKYRLSS